MNRSQSQLCTDFLRSLRFLQSHFNEPCGDSLSTLEEKGYTDFRTRSTSYVILKTLKILVKDGTKLVWNKAKYSEVTPRLANQVFDLAFDKNQADKIKSKANVAEKAREARIFARPSNGCAFASKRSLVLLQTRPL